MKLNATCAMASLGLVILGFASTASAGAVTASTRESYTYTTSRFTIAPENVERVASVRVTSEGTLLDVVTDACLHHTGGTLHLLVNGMPKDSLRSGYLVATGALWSNGKPSSAIRLLAQSDIDHFGCTTHNP